MDDATLTAKGQVTVPKEVRVRAVAPFDLAYLQELEISLSEWSSQEDDDEAFSDLCAPSIATQWNGCRYLQAIKKNQPTRLSLGVSSNSLKSLDTLELNR
ncbi:MAG: hypothetical protein KME02_16115 [Aphanothece saxicola GSE-SYN-MK-01-06B]|jgi:Flp pilus assembly protein CpaB|nr:hypothetical protein [Aphanothece saxicola GSE-SYN-MK-01-06B]